MVGRDAEKKKLLQILMNQNIRKNMMDEKTSQSTSNGDSGGHRSIFVVAITGIGGIGKTALAQVIYDTIIKEVKKHYDLSIWVHVSQNFDVTKILKKILESVPSSSNGNRGDSDTLQTLQDRLRDSIKDKRLLLVLDDLWNEDAEKWNLLMMSLEGTSKRSVILATCGSESVGITQTIEAVYTQKLEALKVADLMDLFKKHAFRGSNLNAKPELNEMAEKIVLNLKGSPLAAKIVGRILNSNLSYEHWNNVWQREIWEFGQDQNRVVSATVMLHYHYQYLPEHLKPCLAYCSLFPRDYVFDKKVMIQMWIAQGFIHTEGGGKKMEDTGDDYVKELLRRSLIRLHEGKEGLFRINNFIHGLARMVSRDDNFVLKAGSSIKTMPESVRHIIAYTDDLDCDIFKSLPNLKHLRTLILVNSEAALKLEEEPVMPEKLQGFLREVLPKAKCLRTLCLRGCTIGRIPNTIGKLKHLRFLEVTGSAIKRLPNSFTKLYHLQVLALESRNDLTGKLSKLIKRLGNVRHLSVITHRSLPGSGYAANMALVGQLPSLQEVSLKLCKKSKWKHRICKRIPIPTIGIAFGGRVFKKERCMKQVQLNGLPIKNIHLNGMNDVRQLRIEGLENIGSKKDITPKLLQHKEFLEDLELSWSSRPEISEEEVLQRLPPSAYDEVLKRLCPSASLKHLRLTMYPGAKPPSWTTSDYLLNLQAVHLERCWHLAILPPVVTSSNIKSLTLKNCPSLLYTWRLNDQRFPLSLVQLTIQKCGPFGQQMKSGDFEGLTSLKTLQLSGCTSLESLPMDSLAELVELTVEECPNLTIRSDLGTGLTSCKILEKLSISNCSKLLGALLALGDNAFPSSLTSIRLQGSSTPPSVIRFDITGIPPPADTPRNIFKRLTSLDSIEICQCPVIELLLGLDGPCCHPQVRNLKISKANGLKLHSELFDSLESLTVEDCQMNVPATEDASIQLLASGNSTLRRLHIQETTASTLQACLWYATRAPRLLKHLQISCIRIESFESAGLEDALPRLPSLTHLSLLDLRSLHTLSEQLNRLSSLQRLEVVECPKVRSLPALPCSLRTLIVDDCPLLKKRLQRKWVAFGSGNKFPPTLRVVIDGCAVPVRKEDQNEETEDT